MREKVLSVLMLAAPLFRRQRLKKPRPRRPVTLNHLLRKL
jgi:hypothetical protein